MLNRNIILLILGVVTCYDILTTMTGTIDILEPGLGAVIASLLLGVIIGGLLYFSYEIHNINSNDFFPALIKPLWFLALIYDLWTSFNGNNRFIVNTELSMDEWGKVLILVGLTLFVSACPIILSYLRNNQYFMKGMLV